MNNLDVECLNEIRRQLNRFRHDESFRGMGKRVPWLQFSQLCSVSRQTLYDLVRGDRKGIEPSTRDRILAALKLVEQGLRWKRIVLEDDVIEWRPVMPNGQPPPPIPQRHLTEKQLAAIARKRAQAKARKHDHPNL